MGQVKAICISEKRGTQKAQVESAAFLPEWGIQGDAHGGNWHRQVSLLSAEKVEQFNKQGAGVQAGAFGENLVVEGFDFSALPVGSLLRCGSVLLEMTQIGKECHTHCTIYHKMGDCIMPREGVFAKVIEPGVIQVGDEMKLEQRTQKKPFQAAVITLSDKGAKGERKDESGPAIVKRLQTEGFEVVETILLPDDKALLEKELCRLSDQRQLSLILTTGGTGFSKRDITPEATLAVADRQAPGIAEAIRAHSMKITPRAMLSRGQSVLRKQTLIVNLPGSLKAVNESLDCFIKEVGHGLDILQGTTADCAQEYKTQKTKCEGK